ncbi:ABC transporter ATP-binding protein [Aurantimonas sp. Leaf443]|uniref:ABC transporter ATP-binding protein n=1 Tax=Aurantimonas sp. Leaf443 TaxID=1736378 RepID=UPI0006FED099|nr:ABC transporter ATP-binding protein [Aurantimonas sp. Leaf443]KQT88212.1 ABC transporter ATP-binding protein [Aurantimonas sp. Leaf443]
MSASPSDAILSARGLTMEFYGFKAVNNVDLDVHRNTIHALIGPNGAGKTTCFNLLTKFLTPTAGTIHFMGRDITRMKPADVARLGLVRSFQISAVFPHLTVLDNVRVALQRKAHLGTQFWRSNKLLHRLDERARELIESVGLGPYADLDAADLSYGRKRALEIATTLALDPPVLLFDEPMAGMGVEDIGRVSDLIRAIARDRTIVMVEHNLNVVADLCDRVTVLARGEILSEGDYATVSSDPRVREAYMGSEHD